MTQDLPALTFHHIPLDLQFPRHEQRLRFRLAGNQFAEIVVGQEERDCKNTKGIVSICTNPKKAPNSVHICATPLRHAMM